MRIGWCAPIARVEAVARIGFDFIEPQLAPLLNELGLDAAKAAVRELPLPASAWGVLLPFGLPTVGPEVRPGALRDHFARAAELLDAADARIMVFGSGWGRIVPEGWSRSAAEDQFIQAVCWAADALAGTKAVLVIEGQNRAETNLVNTVADAVDVARRAERSNVRAMANLHHMVEEGESLDIVVDAAPWVAHVQLADTGRLTPGTGGYDHPGLARRLREGGYAGQVAGEVMYPATEVEMTASLAFMRRTYG